MPSSPLCFKKRTKKFQIIYRRFMFLVPLKNAILRFLMAGLMHRSTSGTFRKDSRKAGVSNRGRLGVSRASTTDDELAAEASAALRDAQPTPLRLAWVTRPGCVPLRSGPAGGLRQLRLGPRRGS